MVREIELMSKFNDFNPLYPPKAISDQIYEKLRKEILQGKIEPGERLIQGKVAREFKTSRMTVQEAFRCLEQDGLAERIPQGGIRVTCLDQETVQEIFGILEVLKIYVIELACEWIRKEEIYFLRKLHNQALQIL